jgi:hypothetical protein|tara:strand:- start:1908 stop:2027 length:120 start_codon:yes stop_codon:yes gene_type:complete
VYEVARKIVKDDFEAPEFNFESADVSAVPNENQAVTLMS